MFRRLFYKYFKKRLFLVHKKQKRVVNIITLADAKSIGILWNPLDPEGSETYESVRQIVSGRGIQSFGIAYIQSKKEKEMLATISHSWLLSNSDVNICGKPKSEDGIRFIQQEFDILIDLSLQKCIELQSILIHAAAKFKIGWKSDDSNIYDLEIDVSANPNCRFLMEQIIHYLEKLNENK